MIDFDTLSLLSDIELVRDMMSHGIVPFSSITEENRDDYYGWLVYDDKNGVELDEDTTKYDIIFDYLVDEEHDDVVSTGSDVGFVYPMYVLHYKSDNSFLGEINLGGGSTINIDGNTWTFYR